MNQLSIKEVLKVSIKTYKERWQTLLLISLLSVLISVSTEMIDLILEVFEFQSISLLLTLIGFVVMVIRIYLTGRLTVTLILAAKASFFNEEVIILDTFNEAKPLTWRYIGYSLIFGLIITFAFFPLGFTIFLGKLFNIGLPVNIVLFALGIALPAYLGSIYYFALISAVIYPEASDVFSYSKKLVKGNFLKVLILLLIPLITIFSDVVFTIIFNTVQPSIITELGITVISKIPNVLLMPFTILISLEAMKRLERMKRMKDDVAS